MICDEVLLDKFENNEIASKLIEGSSCNFSLIFDSKFDAVYCCDSFLEYFSNLPIIFSNDKPCSKKFGEIIDCINAEEGCFASPECVYCCFHSLLEETMETVDWVKETVLFTKKHSDQEKLNHANASFVFQAKAKKFIVDTQTYIGICLKEIE